MLMSLCFSENQKNKIQEFDGGCLLLADFLWLVKPLPNPILDVVSELFLASKTEQRSPLLENAVRSDIGN